MAECRLAISRPQQPGTDLVMGLGKAHYWRLDRAVPWLPASRGTWIRISNATKFRKFNLISLQDQAGKSFARMADYPYSSGQRFKAHLVSHLWVFEAESTESFDVQVRMFPLPKKFRIRETFGGSVSYGVVQGEGIFFEIQDVQTSAVFKYIYKGTGISTPSKLPGSASLAGPWNDFTGPGWMSAADFEGDAVMQSGNVAAGTSLSFNYFSFAGNVDDRVGYLVELNLNTGRTAGLPSIGASRGTMKLWSAPAAPAQVPVRPR